MYRARLQARLKTLITINTDSGCWEWQGQISNSGHGRIMIQEDGITRTVSAEDASYIAFFGKISEQHWIQQTCNNRLCINPEHLELLTSSSP